MTRTNTVYRAADFGAYGFEVRKLGRALYRCVMVVRASHGGLGEADDAVVMVTHETALRASSTGCAKWSGTWARARSTPSWAPTGRKRLTRPEPVLPCVRRRKHP